MDSNARHFFDLVDPRKTCLLRFIVLILAIHAATSFEAAADGSHSGNDPHSDPDRPEPGELILANLAAFRYALAEYNETGMLIEFFLPWCGHSRRLRPELSQVRATHPTNHQHADVISNCA
jgi:thiol-disulfide isomerase/thioredoxin